MSQNSARVNIPMECYPTLRKAAIENDTTNLKQKFEPYLPLCYEFLATLFFLALEYHSCDFVVEILGLKPELIWAKTPDGRAAMHISCEHGLVQIVTELVNINCNLCLVRDNLGRSPIHIAAANGKIEVLQVLIKACPDSLMEFTSSNETALHVAAKNRQVDCVRFLIQQCLEQNRSSLLSWRDNEGNSVIDIATSTNQKQILQMSSLDEIESARCFQSVQRNHQQQLPNNSGLLTIEQTILAFMAGVAFAALGNYRTIFQPEHQARSATFTIMDIISAPNTLPLGFYYIVLITEVFVVSMLVIVRSISEPGGQYTDGFTEIVLFLGICLFMAFGLMMKLFVPHFFITIVFTIKISSFWFVFLLDVTFVLILIPAVFMIKKIHDKFYGRKKLFLGENGENEHSNSPRDNIFNEEQVDKKTVAGEGEPMQDIP